MLKMIKKTILYFKREGLRATCGRAIYFIKIYFGLGKNKTFNIDRHTQLHQQNTQFQKDITISIIVPLYNTPIKFLHEMIASVLVQTYAKWELCLADGSDDKHGYVEKVCRSYINKDKRIKYKKLLKNGGISYNTNEAMSLSTGEYFAMLDHDDILHISALFEVMNKICKTNADLIYSDEAIFHKKPTRCIGLYYKSSFAPDTLRAQNYMTHFCVYSRDLFNAVGPYDSNFDGSQDYDMILRLTEKANVIEHIPLILYYWRAHNNSVAGNIDAKQYAIDAAKNAITAHLKRINIHANVINAEITGMYRVQYKLINTPKISIIIPNKDTLPYLKKCINSILSVSTYPNYEIIIVENNSKNKETFDYYKYLSDDKRINIITWNDVFNFSAICNFGVKHAQGEYCLLLNNDTEVINGNWLEEMLMYAQRDDVGAVGAKLFFPDETIQHAGVILGIGGFAGHSHKGFPRHSHGHMGRLKIVQNVSAVTGACLMTKVSLYKQLNGLDEDFVVSINDVDFCLRLRERGLLIVFTPYAELYHYESKSRGYEDTPEKINRFLHEYTLYKNRWEKVLQKGDPYYNPNLTLKREDFTVK